jgi:indoleacetamide hydrolase
VALLDSVITGDAAPQPASLKGARIGLPRGYFWEGLDGELSQVLDVALARLRDSGVVLVEADLAGIGDINDKISFPIALYEVGPDLSHGPRTSTMLSKCCLPARPNDPNLRCPTMETPRP